MPTKQMSSALGWRFDNSYAQLPEVFFKKVLPEKVPAPKVVLFNERLAENLGLHFGQATSIAIANLLSGNIIPEGAEPIAQAYAGHQFGHFTMLGDGRAILLGEHLTPDQLRYDIQLKGAGQTPFSRRGDGKSTLRAALREYLISECMYALNIPTSESLAVVSTGEQVYRESIHEGAVLTRVMQSHIRVGTFEYARHFLSSADLNTLLQYTIKRHFPQLIDSPTPAIDFIKAVMEKQIALITHWMRVGFIHGVMNTDNMSVVGVTFDYGPCAFMNHYHPRTVFSSIDTNGRYAFGNQPRIALWNIACLAGALLPLVHANENEAIEQVKNVLDSFEPAYDKAWLQMMGRKIGIPNLTEQDRPLILSLLHFMQHNEADFTNTFCYLMGDLKSIDTLYTTEEFTAWLEDWSQLRKVIGVDWETSVQIMRLENPQVIPRNHLVEAALDAATLHHDTSLLDNLLSVMKKAYIPSDGLSAYQTIPKDIDKSYVTYCGT
jgi:uncharacterized protein YdiU (UPF0061 family)